MKRKFCKILAAPLIFIMAIATVNASDIVDVASKAGKFKLLLTAATEAGLVDALKSKGPLTVLAPTDEAFGKLPKGALEDLLKPVNKDKLASILKYHVISGKVDARKVASLESATTLLGKDVSIGINNGRLTVGTANVIGTDIMASNGIIHVIDQVLLPPEESEAEKLSGLIETAVETGAPLYNKGQEAACVAIYKIAVQSLAIAGKDILPEGSIKDLNSALSKVKKSHSSSSNAWTLRGALDRTYKSLTNMKPESKQSTKMQASPTSNADANFKVLLEAELPEGFPKPGPVNQIVVKEYPVYRAARVGGANMQNVAFMRLFAHIKQNGISMTAPVEMAIDGDTAQRQDMAFLYGNKRIGKAGSASAGVEVLDLPAKTYVSIGIRGTESKAAIKGAVSKLENWLKENKEFISDGEPRLLGYNSPMVPRDKRFWEVQIPVKTVQ